LLRNDRGIRYKAECQNISYIHTYICMCAKRTHKICSVPLLYNRGQSNGEENKKICTNKSLSLITCICQFSIIYFILLYLYIIRTYLIVKTSVHKKYLWLLHIHIFLATNVQMRMEEEDALAFAVLLVHICL